MTFLKSLTLISNHLFPERSLKNINWTSKHLLPNVEVQAFNFPYELSRVYEKTAFKDERRKTWHLNVIRTTDTNKKIRITTWKKDIFFATKEN